MGMNSRTFARAHDKYLEPEEERPDCEDEDRAYEEAKQRRIDEEDAQVRKAEAALYPATSTLDWPTVEEIKAADANYFYSLKTATEEAIFWEEEERLRKAQR